MTDALQIANAGPLSLIGRALTPEGWRVLRRKLPPGPRRMLPAKPPAAEWYARELLINALKQHWLDIACAETPAWRPRISDIAKAGGFDRGTVLEWARAAGCYDREGRIRIDQKPAAPWIDYDEGAGYIDLRAAAERVAPGTAIGSLEEAIDVLDAWLAECVRNPRPRWTDVPSETPAGEQDLPDPDFLGLSDWLGVQPYSLGNENYELGTSERRYPVTPQDELVTVTELAALLDQSPEDGPGSGRVSHARVRAWLAQAGATFKTEGGRDYLERSWLRGAGGACFWALVEADHKSSQEKARSSKNRDRLAITSDAESTGERPSSVDIGDSFLRPA